MKTPRYLLSAMFREAWYTCILRTRTTLGLLTLNRSQNSSMDLKPREKHQHPWNQSLWTIKYLRNVFRILKVAGFNQHLVDLLRRYNTDYSELDTYALYYYTIGWTYFYRYKRLWSVAPVEVRKKFGWTSWVLQFNYVLKVATITSHKNFL